MSKEDCSDNMPYFILTFVLERGQNNFSIGLENANFTTPTISGLS